MRLQLIGHVQVRVPALLINRIVVISTLKPLYNGYNRKMAR